MIFWKFHFICKVAQYFIVEGFSALLSFTVIQKYRIDYVGSSSSYFQSLKCATEIRWFYSQLFYDSTIEVSASHQDMMFKLKLNVSSKLAKFRESRNVNNCLISLDEAFSEYLTRFNLLNLNLVSKDTARCSLKTMWSMWFMKIIWINFVLVLLLPLAQKRVRFIFSVQNTLETRWMRAVEKVSEISCWEMLIKI